MGTRRISVGQQLVKFPAT